MNKILGIQGLKLVLRLFSVVCVVVLYFDKMERIVFENRFRKYFQIEKNKETKKQKTKNKTKQTKKQKTSVSSAP